MGKNILIMKRINTVEQLIQKIDRELSWRKFDLTGIKFDMQQQKSKDERTIERHIKYGIVILYSHWEGAVKNVADYYLNFVSCQSLPYRDLQLNFLAVGLRDLIKFSGETQKSTVKNQLVNKVLNNLDEPSKIPTEGVISANSNLNYDILIEILATIGVDELPFSRYQNWIDKKLLQNRNFIAHGENFNRLDGVVTIDNYLEIHDNIVEALDLFADTIKDYAQNQRYLNSK